MLQLISVSKAYGANTVLQDVSLLVNPGERLGLVGPNGCGKTTLLRIIAGREQADRGQARLNPPSLRLGYLEQGLIYAEGETIAGALRVQAQGLDEAEERLAQLASALAEASEAERARIENAYAQALANLQTLAASQTAAHDAEAILAGLGLCDVEMDTPVAILSGGQKTRLGLACILLTRPQVLLLDEPTNHLDIEALEWLESWLRAFPGAALVVSHDRDFLDRTVTGILDLDPHTHTVRAYAGNYSSYVEEKQAELDRQWQAYGDQNEEIARLQAAAQHLRNEARPHRGGKADSGDKYAKGFFINRVQRYTVRRAKHIEERIERLLTSERVEKPKPTWQMKLDFGAPPLGRSSAHKGTETSAPSGRDVLMLEGLAAGYGENVLLRDVSQHLRLGERVALVGPNGSGKTTLLRAIAGQLPPLAGRVRLGANVRLGYYSQEQEGLDPSSTPLDTILRTAAMSETEARSFLHYFLFGGDDVFISVGDLSYGERARLVLARLVAEGCNCLLLDEPINHLDIPSRASFERAMAAYEGTVLAAVHDRYFIRHFAGRLWAVEDGTIVEYLDLERWEHQRQ